jgi:hypothetical protein
MWGSSTAKMWIECLHRRSPELGYFEDTERKYLETMATDLLQYISDNKLRLPLRLMLDFELETGVEWPDLYDWLEKKVSCLVARLMEETSGDFRLTASSVSSISVGKQSSVWKIGECFQWF